MNVNFREMKKLCRKLDKGIEDLEKTWDSPHVLVAGYNDNIDEDSPRVERFFAEIKQLKDQSIADKEQRKIYMSAVDERINTVQVFCEQCKQDFDDVEMFLSDWGYNSECKSPDSTPTDNSEQENISPNLDQTINNPSPCVNYSEKKKAAMFNHTPTVRIDKPKSIATPVITSLASVLKSNHRNRFNASIQQSLNHPELFQSPYYGANQK